MIDVRPRWYRLVGMMTVAGMINDLAQTREDFKNDRGQHLEQVGIKPPIPACKIIYHCRATCYMAEHRPVNVIFGP